MKKQTNKQTSSNVHLGAPTTKFTWQTGKCSLQCAELICILLFQTVERRILADDMFACLHLPLIIRCRGFLKPLRPVWVEARLEEATTGNAASFTALWEALSVSSLVVIKEELCRSHLEWNGLKAGPGGEEKPGEWKRSFSFWALPCLHQSSKEGRA